MFFLARKNLTQEKTRFLISVGGVAFSVALIIVLVGLYHGWDSKLGEYIRSAPVDVWVMQKGSEELFHTPSLLPLNLDPQLTRIDGVASARPFAARRVAVTSGDKNFQLYVVGYNPASNTGGPKRVVRGKAVPGPGEIIIDQSQSKKAKIGSLINAGADRLKVAGFSQGGDLVISSFAFTLPGELDKIQKIPPSANYYWVSLKPGADKAATVQKIEAALPGVSAFTRERFVKNNTKIVSDSFLPVILVLVIVSIAVGIAFIGLTIFTSTIEKSKEYGVLKAIGLKNKQLYLMVIEQALIAGVIGFVIGAGLAYGLSTTVGRVVPQFVTQIRPFDVVWIFMMSLVMSVVAAYIPIHRLNRIDPAEVFRA